MRIVAEENGLAPVDDIRAIGHVDPQLDAAFPAQRAARVAIHARGRREAHLQPPRIGDPDAPLSDAQLDEKYLELAVPVLRERAAKEELKRLWAL